MAKKKPAANNDDQKPSFEDSLAELEKIVGELEAGQLPLSDSIERYEKGVKLLKRCHQTLEQVQRKIEVLTRVNKDGTASTVPFDADDPLTDDDQGPATVDDEGRLF
ncbi:MAG: exodeoxyribonuclease VII small subunit [Pirellulaceae bacterium]